VVVEEHGRGRQLVRSRIWPRVADTGWRALVALSVFALACGVADQPLLAVGAVALTLVVAAIAVWECGLATAALVAAVDASASEPAARPVAEEPAAATADWQPLKTAEGELA
jgi:hypothetical protein